MTTNNNDEIIFTQDTVGKVFATKEGGVDRVKSINHNSLYPVEMYSGRKYDFSGRFINTGDSPFDFSHWLDVTLPPPAPKGYRIVDAEHPLTADDVGKEVLWKDRNNKSHCSTIMKYIKYSAGGGSDAPIIETIKILDNYNEYNLYGEISRYAEDSNPNERITHVQITADRE